jgi:hypothetical protein
VKTRAASAVDVQELEDIPNIGPAIAADLRSLGIDAPSQLRGNDPYALYDRLCLETGVRQDPCLLDTFIAAVRFMDGGPRLPWWAFTPERKKELAARASGESDGTRLGAAGAARARG